MFELSLVHDVDVDNLTPASRAKMKEIVGRVLDGDGFRLVACQERGAERGLFTLTLVWEPDPNPADKVTYRPIGK